MRTATQLPAAGLLPLNQSAVLFQWKSLVQNRFVNPLCNCIHATSKLRFKNNCNKFCIFMSPTKKGGKRKLQQELLRLFFGIITANEPRHCVLHTQPYTDIPEILRCRLSCLWKQTMTVQLQTHSFLDMLIFIPERVMAMPGPKPFPHWPNAVTRTQLWVSPKFWVLTSAALGACLDAGSGCVLIQVKRSHVHCLECGCETVMQLMQDGVSQYAEHLLAVQPMCWPTANRMSNVARSNNYLSNKLFAWHMLKDVQLNAGKMRLWNKRGL